MSITRVSLTLILPIVLAACTVAPPTGPSVFVLPPEGKDLARFQTEDISCRNYAAAQIGYGNPAQAGSQAAVGSAAIGTALGAAAGALIGSAGGSMGSGAAIGAGTGLLAGSAVGAGTAQTSTATLQDRYDLAYAQCMASSGNTIASPQPAVPYYGYGYPDYASPKVSFGVYSGYGRGYYGRGWRHW
jgi:hypothetical protein